MKKVWVLATMFAAVSTVKAQKFTAGVYAGIGFTQEKSDYFNVSTLPMEHGGSNFHYGVHFNYEVAKRIAIETGLQKVTKGYTYTTPTGFPVSSYNKITTISVPIVALVHLLNYPEDLPIRVSFGAGAYISYAVSGKVIDDSGNSSSAKFSNSKRMEVGPRFMLKGEFVHRFELYVADDIPSSNTIKNGSGYVKQGSLQFGAGYIFKFKKK